LVCYSTTSIDLIFSGAFIVLFDVVQMPWAAARLAEHCFVCEFCQDQSRVEAVVDARVLRDANPHSDQTDFGRADVGNAIDARRQVPILLN
jgi:hypothetical protein